MRPLLPLTLLLATTAAPLAAQVIFAPEISAPEFRVRKSRERYVAAFAGDFPGEIQQANLGAVLTERPDGTRLRYDVYPETSTPTALARFPPRGRVAKAGGPGYLWTPDRVTTWRGEFRDGLAEGEWTRLRLTREAAAACPAAGEERPLADVLAACREVLASERGCNSTIATVDYRRGRPEGIARERTVGGLLIAEETYEHGRVDGLSTRYDSLGEAEWRGRFRAGRLVGTEFPPQGIAPDSVTGHEQMPAFLSPGCPPQRPRMTTEEKQALQRCAQEAMLTYIYEEIEYPKAARRQGIAGISVVTFVVERDGNLADIRTVRFVSASIDAEARRVVESMPPWVPGVVDGEPVRVQFNLPIAFRLE